MRSPRRCSLAGAMTLLLVCATGAAWATPSAAFSFENADVQTVIKRVGELTGITFLFDPEQVRGRITLLAPRPVSPAEALELLKSALALRGYRLLNRAEGMWIVPAAGVAHEAITVTVVPLTYARSGSVS